MWFPAGYLEVDMVVGDWGRRRSSDLCDAVPQRRQVQGASKVADVKTGKARLCACRCYRRTWDCAYI